MAQGLFTLRQVNQAIRQGAWSAFNPPQFVEYLCVAGGGGAGFTGNGSGGGGAGGVLSGIVPVTAGTSYTVTIGSGGAGSSSQGAVGSSGVASVFGSITSTGGGGGASGSLNGTLSRATSGGSGGGGTGGSSGIGDIGAQGTVNQGNSGGNGSGNFGGGGGGAGTIGLSGITSVVAGNGGAGIASGITGTVTTYAGGGAGGINATGRGTGGVGGGGSTGASADTTGGSGTANTGGGGGGGWASGLNQNGGSGGSGIVIVSYPDVYAAPTATTGSPTVSTSGSGSISFNGSSQYLSTSATQVIPATGDFTIEAWIYPTSFSGSPVFCGQGSAGDAGRTLFFISTGGVPTFSNGSSFTFTSTGTVSLNTWTYIAFTRSGSTGTWYINGASAGTGSLSGITVQNTFVTIGGSNPLWTAQYFTGYISNFRISDAARIISSTPTAPFNPSTSNTKMLLLTASGAFLADASTNAYTFTNNGTSTWNQLSPFATGSGYKNRVYTWTSSGSITF